MLKLHDSTRVKFSHVVNICAALTLLLFTGCVRGKKTVSIIYDGQKDEYHVLSVYREIHSDDEKSIIRDIDHLKQLWLSRWSLITEPSGFDGSAYIRLKANQFCHVSLGSQPDYLEVVRSTLPLDRVDVRPGRFFLDESSSLAYYHQLVFPGDILDKALDQLNKSRFGGNAEEIAKSIRQELEKRSKGLAPSTWDAVGRGLIEMIRTQGEQPMSQPTSPLSTSPLDADSLRALERSVLDGTTYLSRDGGKLALQLPLSEADVAGCLAMTRQVKSTAKGSELGIGKRIIEAIDVKANGPRSIRLTLDMAEVFNLDGVTLEPGKAADASTKARCQSTLELAQRQIPIDRSLSVEQVVKSFRQGTYTDKAPDDVSTGPLHLPKRAYIPLFEGDVGKPLELGKHPQLDEELFLIYMLERWHTEWPANVDDPRALAATLAFMKARARRYDSYIRERGLDEGISRAYSGYIESAAAYVEFLVQMGAVDREAVEAAENASARAAASALDRGARAGVAIAGRSGSGESALAGTLLVGAASYLWDSYQSDARIEQSKKEAVAISKAKLEDQVTGSLAQTEGIVNAVALRRGWTRKESDFDPVSRGTRRDGRPRDPFCLTSKSANYVDDLKIRLSLIPPSRQYDAERVSLLEEAARFMLGYAERNRDWANCPTKDTAMFASIFARAILELDPKDPDGTVRSLLARSLAFQGDVFDTLKMASEVADLRGNDVKHSYLMAYCYNAVGDTKTSLSLIDSLVQKHGYFRYGGFALLRDDPNLSRTLATQAEGIRKLFTAKGTFDVTFNNAGDTVVFTNQSPFPIYFVDLDVTVTEPTSGGTWKQKFTADEVGAGQGVTWKTKITQRPGFFTRVQETASYTYKIDNRK